MLITWKELNQPRPSLSQLLARKEREFWKGWSTYLKQLRKDMSLTRREAQILCLLCLGKSEKLIAYDLHITQATVWFHKRRLKEKTGEVELTGLIRYAIKRGYLPLDTFLTPSAQLRLTGDCPQSVSPSSHPSQSPPSRNQSKTGPPSTGIP